jgi:MFS family permease
MTNFVANSAYSSIAPFFPQAAIDKGLPKDVLGYIFSGYSLSMVIFSPLLSRLLSKYGKKKVLVMGLLCESIAMLAFATFNRIQEPVAYGILCFVCRVIEGFGNGCLNSATSSIIVCDYHDHVSKLIGLTQTFTGLGMLAGPVMGGFLYELGGFSLPFYVTGVWLFALVFPILLFLRNDNTNQP